MNFANSMIRLRTLDIYPIVAVDFVCNLIRPDLAHHPTPAAAESIIPNPTLQDFVVVPINLGMLWSSMPLSRAGQRTHSLLMPIHQLP
jgi:hypothetical protein